jgi:hypothetical protein
LTGEPKDSVVDVEFELPVSLPPSGRYEAIVGPPWKLGRRAEPASVRAIAAVVDGKVELEFTGDDLQTGDVRIVLIRTAEEASPG